MTRLVERATPYSGGARAQDGVTVFASTDDGRRDVLVRALMPIRGALLSICRELDARPECWYVDVISTPSTIWRDLQGTRAMQGRDESGLQLLTPEAQYLGQVGRLDLLRERV